MKIELEKLLKTVKEYTAMIVAVVLFFLSGPVIRLIDPVAAPYDSGIIQNIVITIAAFCVFQATTWSVVKNIWPMFGIYAKNGSFETDFKLLTAWQRSKLFLFVYSFIFLLLALLFLKTY